MKVFKFGGASVKDAESVRNLSNIVKLYREPLVIVVSAMGKTTNALEIVAEQYFNKEAHIKESVEKLKKMHIDIVKQLFSEQSDAARSLEMVLTELDRKLSTEPSMTFNFEYDQVVSFGEILSTVIVEAFLRSEGINSEWVDIRKVLKTDDTFREAHVNFDVSESLVKDIFNKKKVYLTQGFIGSTVNNLTTTLGREGSDYTAALLAFFLDAESVTVWKDVPGVLNADPKWFDNTVKIPRLKYSDAIELAFYGASVIHPKTIQPLKQKTIPLHVRSFVYPLEDGSTIGEEVYEELIPCFIFKMDQVLIDIYPPDLAFVGEDNFKTIFDMLSRHRIKVNLMQNTAVHFRICVNNDPTRIPRLVRELSLHYQVGINSPLELITIRYFDQKTIDRVMINKELVLEQRTQTTVQILVKDLGHHNN
jgi:aspartate kinase